MFSKSKAGKNDVLTCNSYIVFLLDCYCNMAAVDSSRPKN